MHSFNLEHKPYMKYNIFATIIGLLLFAGCGKNSDIFIPKDDINNLKGNINNFYLSVRNTVPAEVFTIHPDVENVVTTSTGLRVLIPASAFTDSTEVTIKDDIIVKITQLSKKSDFIKYSQFSNTSDFVLDWFKNINFEVTTLSGKKLLLKNDSQVTVQLPTTSISPNWKLFNGTYYSTRMFQVLPNEYAVIKSAVWKDGTTGTIVEGIEFKVKKTGWVCIATPVKIEKNKSLHLELPASFRSFNTMTSVSYKSGNIIYLCDGSNGVPNIFSQRIHDLKNLTVLIASDMQYSYFASKTEFSEYHNDSTVVLTPQKTNYTEMVNLLDKLN